MSEAPERIWINKAYGKHPGDWDFTDGKHLTKKQLRGMIEYVRADRIEELEAKLKSETERLGREVNLARYGQPDFAWSIHVQAMAELEAKLAKAVGALEKMCVGEGWAAQIASTTLAELTGGKDE